MEYDKVSDKKIEEISCGCIIFRRHSFLMNNETRYGIDYCPKHSAAPDMYEALKELMQAVDSGQERIGAGRGMRINISLTKAEGK